MNCRLKITWVKGNNLVTPLPVILGLIQIHMIQALISKTESRWRRYRTPTKQRQKAIFSHQRFYSYVKMFIYFIFFSSYFKEFSKDKQYVCVFYIYCYLLYIMTYSYLNPTCPGIFLSWDCPDLDLKPLKNNQDPLFKLNWIRFRI